VFSPLRHVIFFTLSHYIPSEKYVKGNVARDMKIPANSDTQQSEHRISYNKLQRHLNPVSTGATKAIKLKIQEEASCNVAVYCEHFLYK
jgi:hypothetical protein